MIPRLLGRASARLQRRSTLAAVGGGSLALAFGVAFVPWLFPESVFRPVSEVVAAPATVAVLGLAAALLAASALRAGATGERPERWLPKRSPEPAHYEEIRTVGVGVDEALDADPRETDDLDDLRRAARRHVRSVAVTVVADAQNCDRDAARDRLSDGSWTDDPRAAAFLGGRELAPLRLRIRDWASGERFDRWASHAVAELDGRTDADDRGDGDRSDSHGTDSGRFDDVRDDDRLAVSEGRR